MSSASPYKKFKSANQSWIGNINIANVQPNKAYKMEDIVTTNHEKYGPGQLATIEESSGKKYKVQLPGKYLRLLQPGDIETFKKDIQDKKPGLLVYRETLIDKSYRIDIIAWSPEMMDKFKSNVDIPELDDDPNDSTENPVDQVPAEQKVEAENGKDNSIKH